MSTHIPGQETQKALKANIIHTPIFQDPEDGCDGKKWHLEVLLTKIIRLPKHCFMPTSRAKKVDEVLQNKKRDKKSRRQDEGSPASPPLDVPSSPTFRNTFLGS
ncbi:hypothetical protein Adt_33128 [Abeliophyllum distichum]|uniref:Uncharacterized protein n=1 Tax=Abeliophyllum distichum TaxID=126358 RepID=A0ABD1QVD1_9LAMI